VAAFADGNDLGTSQLVALEEILDDLSGDDVTAQEIVRSHILKGRDSHSICNLDNCSCS
jgi:hypothetical protein